jgi:hypothetical protein
VKSHIRDFFQRARHLACRFYQALECHLTGLLTFTPDLLQIKVQTPPQTPHNTRSPEGLCRACVQVI